MQDLPKVREDRVQSVRYAYDGTLAASRSDRTLHMRISLQVHTGCALILLRAGSKIDRRKRHHTLSGHAVPVSVNKQTLYQEKLSVEEYDPLLGEEDPSNAQKLYRPSRKVRTLLLHRLIQLLRQASTPGARCKRNEDRLFRSQSNLGSAMK